MATAELKFSNGKEQGRKEALVDLAILELESSKLRNSPDMAWLVAEMRRFGRAVPIPEQKQELVSLAIQELEESKLQHAPKLPWLVAEMRQLGQAPERDDGVGCGYLLGLGALIGGVVWLVLQ